MTDYIRDAVDYLSGWVMLAGILLAALGALMGRAVA